MKKIDFKKAIHDRTQSIPLSLLETDERIKSQIIIIDEIRDFIHPLNADEFSGLERTLLEEGINDPLIVWETTAQIAGIDDSENLVYVLIDGHHRYKISQKHQLPFSILIKKYPTLDAVKAAMLDKQLNRRNLTPEQISYYRGLKYNILKTNQVGVEKHINVAHELSKEFGVNEKTIRRDATFATGLDKLSPELRNEVLSGQLNLPKASIGVISKMDNVQNISSSEQLEKLVDDALKNTHQETKNTEKTPNIASIKHQIRQIANSDFDKKGCEQMIESLNVLLGMM